jgi:hypothetical protein
VRNLLSPVLRSSPEETQAKELASSRLYWHRQKAGESRFLASLGMTTRKATTTTKAKATTKQKQIPCGNDNKKGNNKKNKISANREESF